MRHRVRALVVIFVLVAQICLAVAAPLPAAADSSPAPCPSVPDPAGVEAAFAFDIQSPEILRFTSGLASLAAPDQKRAFDAAMKAVGTPQEREAETAVAATCPTLDGIYGKVRAMAVIVNRWQLPELDDKQFDELSDVVETAVEALAAGDALAPDVRGQALLPFADTLAPADQAVPPSTQRCAQPNQNARPVNLAEPTYPAISAALGTHGQVAVKVTLTETGDVRSAALYSQTVGDGTGAGELIESAILAAGTSTYAPEVINCRPIAGGYLFKVDFGRT
jgi:hypothetical protein